MKQFPKCTLEDIGNSNSWALTPSQVKPHRYSKENLGLVNEVVCTVELGQKSYLNIYFTLHIYKYYGFAIYEKIRTCIPIHIPIIYMAKQSRILDTQHTRRILLTYFRFDIIRAKGMPSIWVTKLKLHLLLSVAQAAQIHTYNILYGLIC